MQTITLTELILRSKERANMENGSFVDDDEWTHFLNDEIADVYAQMVNIDDGELFGIVSPTLVSIGDNSYQLPNDFMRLIDVNIYTSGRWVPAWKSDPQEYYQLLSSTNTGDYDTAYFLRLNLQQGRYELFIFPAKEVENIGVRYIPEAPRLSVGTDSLKWPSNWHECLVAGAAVKALVKEESDPTGVAIERDTAIRRVLKDVRSQKVAEIKTLRSVSSNRRFRLPKIY
jgi:hypothetical protein